MIIYWNRNIAGTHRGQAFMIKGQKFLQWYISGRNIVTSVIDSIILNSYIETSMNLNSYVETSKNLNSQIETSMTLESEVK